MPFYFNPLYMSNNSTLLLWFLPLLFAIFAQIKVSSAFKKYSKVPNQRGMTGAQAAQFMLNEAGIHDVKIEHIKSMPGQFGQRRGAASLSDHFDPRSKTIRLSEGVYNSTSVAALGIAAHEAGHAVQYHQQYAPIKARNAILKPAQFGSTGGFYLAFFGILFSMQPLIWIGIALFTCAVLFQLITLPVEFDASRRAMRTLSDTGMLYGDELKGARKVLSAAAMTYVAALASSIGNLLRLLLMSSRRR